jgi:putative heme-binding domain-containing protein
MLRVLALLSTIVSAHAQWTTSRIHGSPEAPKPYVPEQVFAQIALNDALEMIAVPGAQRFVAVEKGGRIWSFKDSPDATSKDLLIDLKPDHPALNYAYGIAFHPKWRENGLVFITYAYGDKVPDGSKLSRFKLTQQEPPVLDPKSETVLLTWQSGGHNGASIQFGPDGMLYISTGDATAPSPPDSLKTGQDLSDFLSSILRIDVDHEENGKAYAIPKDNPFLKTPKAMPEIYAFGFRNPWKISFDPKGRLWCGDVGWELWEMIHLVPKGGNHGWSAMEASQPIMPETKGPGDIIPPVAAHPHTEAASITGGYVYHGSRFPELRDAYIYGDYETGKIWALWHDGTQVTRREEIADTPHKIVSFGQSEDGEVYWMNWEKDTRLYRLSKNPAVGKPSQFPRKLSETGLFTDTTAQTPAAGVLPFEIAEPMWQDGAKAQRFVALPEGKSIQTTVSGPSDKPNYKVEWPAESVLARTITLKKKIETQVLHFDGETWNGYSYRWNDTGTDAELVGPDGEEFAIDKQPWRIHGRAECARCHNNWSGFALGFQPDQLVSISGKKAEAAAELFNGPFFERLKNRLVSSRDKQADLESKARSWLHANCAHCHRRHGGGSVQLMVNADLPTSETMMIYEKPVRGDFGIADSEIVYPGAPHRSILLDRIARVGSGRMPMIGAREVDRGGLMLLRNWILSLPPNVDDELAAADKKTWINYRETMILMSVEKSPKIDNPLSFFHSPFHMMDAVLNKWLPQPLHDQVIQAALSSSEAHDVALFEQFVPPEKRAKTLGMNFDAKKLLAVKGDAKRGAELVSMTGKMATCLACHILNGTGRDFGPDLSKVGARLTREQILESLHQPSKAIAKGYETWMLTLKDGSVQTGFVVNPGDTAVTLKLPTGQPQTFERSQIRSQKVEPMSLMPEGLLQAMTEQEAADVIAFLSGLK